jgi:hypothetical protein
MVHLKAMRLTGHVAWKENKKCSHNCDCKISGKYRTLNMSAAETTGQKDNLLRNKRCSF